MRALDFDGHRLELKELPDPKPAPGEALIRVELAGICRTDFEIVKGYMAFRGVPGHEFVGWVAAGDDPEWMGKRVVGEINLACGRCAFCEAGLPRHCPARKTLGIAGKNGAFAEFLTLPIANLHEVPEEVPDEAAVFVEPIAACYEIIEQMVMMGNERLLVLGDGKLGILAARVLAGSGAAEVVLAGRHPEKLALAASDKIKTTMIDELMKTAGDPFARFSVVVEATGRPEGFAAALALTRPRGTIVVKTTVATPTSVDLARIVVDEITVIGSRCGPFEPAIEALHSGEVKVDDLVAARLPLAQGVEAIALASAPGALKVLLEVGPT